MGTGCTVSALISSDDYDIHACILSWEFTSFERIWPVCLYTGTMKTKYIQGVVSTINSTQVSSDKNLMS